MVHFLLCIMLLLPYAQFQSFSIKSVTAVVKPLQQTECTIQITELYEILVGSTSLSQLAFPVQAKPSSNSITSTNTSIGIVEQYYSNALSAIQVRFLPAVASKVVQFTVQYQTMELLKIDSSTRIFTLAYALQWPDKVLEKSSLTMNLMQEQDIQIVESPCATVYNWQMIKTFSMAMIMTCSNCTKQQFNGCNNYDFGSCHCLCMHSLFIHCCYNLHYLSLYQETKRKTTKTIVA